MKRHQALDILTQHRDALKQLGVLSLAIFGSVARDRTTPDSDVDVLVDFERSLTCDRYMDVKFYLEDCLETRVDLVSQGALKPQLRQVVEQEAIDVS